MNILNGLSVPYFVDKIRDKLERKSNKDHYHYLNLFNEHNFLVSGNPSFYVNGSTGTDSFDDPEQGIYWDKPFKTINRALDVVKASVNNRSSIYVAPGTYNETFTVYGVSTVSIVGVSDALFTPADPETVIINGGSSQAFVFLVSGGSVLNVKNLKILSTTYQNPAEALYSGIFQASAATIIGENIIAETRSRHSHIVYSTTGSHVQLSGRFTIRGNTAASLFAAHTFGNIYLFTTVNPDPTTGIYIQDTITLYNTSANAPAGSGALVRLWRAGNCMINYNPMGKGVGAITGYKYNIDTNGSLGQQTYLPATSVAGIVAAPGTVS